LNEPGIQDAIFNANLNNIKNATFKLGKAEEVLSKLLRQYSAATKNIVGIVDPPRAGLHVDAIRAIRSCRPLKRLIYVSCNQNSLIVNASSLCRAASNTLKGDPFKPVLAAAIDLFPSTAHYELVVLFEREDTTENISNAKQEEVQNNKDTDPVT